MNLKSRVTKLEEKIEPDTFLVFYNPELAAADTETQLRYCLENGLDKNKVLFANDIDMAL
jgi:ribulose bisphosphate carboxylase small subunit